MRKLLGLAGTVALLAVALYAAQLYQEPYRLQYHFSPTRTWTNDPNGLVWYKGEFHLFYQNNPFGNKWGHMSWGHAVSVDLMHWRELPVAIPEENGIMIFSGSAVVDETNSSGLCRPGPDCLVALYTGHTPTLQTQNVAYSNDRGRTWSKYKGNPVIDLHMKDFRDPKVIWYAPGRKWVMAAALPNEHKVRFFGSTNLLQWTALGDFGPAGATGGQWECPDLFALPPDIGSKELKWVLIVNVNPGGVQGGSATQYFVGKFEGHTFTSENPASTTLWADWGKDFYAAVSWFNSPPGDPRKYWIGWFGNWEYAADEPTAPQRGAMTIPRTVMLRHEPEGTRLVQAPVTYIALLHGTEMSMKDREIGSVNTDIRKEGFRGHELDIDVAFAPNGAKEFGVLVHQGAKERTVVGVSGGKLFIDRTQSGDVGFSPKFPGRQSAPLAPSKVVRLHILLDRSSVEVFANDGQIVMSDRVFPSAASDGLEFFANRPEARIATLRMWKMRSAWPPSAGPQTVQ